MGHDVVTVGDDPAALAELNRGKSPIYEPKLNVILRRNLRSGRLRFTSHYDEALRQAEFIFIAIDTPVNDRDEPQLESVFEAARKVGKFRKANAMLCVTSQVPVGTCERLAALVSEQQHGIRCDVVYIPEFLRLGDAVNTFCQADRFVIGAQRRAVAERVAQLYAPLKRPILLIGLRSAEIAKHACNTYLATSISFINEISDLCERVGADVLDVSAAMKTDRRIGPYAFLNPGLGFAGGTLGREIRALQELGLQHGCKMRLMDAVSSINGDRNHMVKERLLEIYPSLKDLRVGVLGITYKPKTSTLRRSVALEIISDLAGQGAEVQVYDPLADLREAGPTPRFVVAHDPYELAEGRDALILITEWDGILELDLHRVCSTMRKPVFIDTRNLFDPTQMSKIGFLYSGIGRGSFRSEVARA